MIPDFMPAMPEILLGVGAMVLLMVGVFSPEKSAYKLVNSLSVLLLLALAAGHILGAFGGERAVTFGSLFVADPFAVFAKIVILLAGAATLAMAPRYLSDKDIAKFEYPILGLLATLGMLVMVSANDLITLYVGLELQSLALYVLAAFNRDRGRSTEAGLKYFVLGALSSGMLLFGISYIYGFTGTTAFDSIAEALSHGAAGELGLIVGMVFLLAGLAFKIAAVPFHMWSPDVYEGSPTPVTAFFAAAPKVAALALMVRVLMTGFVSAADAWLQIIIFISIASMLLGAFVALVQTNIKRLLAYSSIGHMGYALVGLAAAGAESAHGGANAVAGIDALLLYLAIYITMTVGTFGVVLLMRKGDQMVEEINDLAGLARFNLPLATAMGILMFSLAGIPLLAGFFGKWYVFLAAVEAGLWPLAIIGVVSSVVGAYYYLRIVKIMFFDEGEGGFDLAGAGTVTSLVGVSALINSPLSYLLLIAPLSVATGWAANALLL